MRHFSTAQPVALGSAAPTQRASSSLQCSGHNARPASILLGASPVWRITHSCPLNDTPALLLFSPPSMLVSPQPKVAGRAAIAYNAYAAPHRLNCCLSLRATTYPVNAKQRSGASATRCMAQQQRGHRTRSRDWHGMRARSPPAATAQRHPIWPAASLGASVLPLDILLARLPMS